MSLPRCHCPDAADRDVDPTTQPRVGVPEFTREPWLEPDPVTEPSPGGPVPRAGRDAALAQYRVADLAGLGVR